MRARGFSVVLAGLLLLARGGAAEDVVPAPGTGEPSVAPAPAVAPPARTAPVVYRTPAEVEERLRALAQAHPERLRLQVLGTSAGGRPLLLALVGRDDLPLVFVHGGLGRRDAPGTAAALDFLERLLEPTPAGETSPLEQVAYAVLPAPNPDALAAFLGGAPWTYGGPNLDRDRDGRRAEDGPEDLDGDGEIVSLRRLEQGGPLALDDAPPKDGKAMGDPRLLREAGPDVRRARSYAPLVEEGRDDDADGDVDEDPAGTDLTRNLIGVWEELGAWSGDGPFPGSAPETQAILEWSSETPRLLAWYAFVGEGPRLERASEKGADADSDDALYALLAPRWTEVAGGVPLRKASEGAGAGANPGSDLDWAARHLGLLALRVPVWRIPKEDGNGRERADPDELDWLLWNDRVLAGKGFVPWHAFDHPTWGPVELGGWTRFSRHEPPRDMLPAAVRAVSWVPSVHAAFAPALEVAVVVKDLGAGVLEVTARALNVGGGPTETARTQAARRAAPVRLAFEPGQGTTVLAGPALARVGILAAGARSAEVTWLLRGAKAGPLGRVVAAHRIAGRAAREVLAP